MMPLEPLKPINEKLKDMSYRLRRKPLRQAYMVRFVIRCIILALTILCYFLARPQLRITTATRWTDFFTSGISFAHFVWCIWVLDMILQLIPVKRFIPIGSQKNFKMHYLPAIKKVNAERIAEHLKGLTAGAYKVFALYAAMVAAIGILHHFRILSDLMLFLASAIFYVCDLICVLFWCPFRVFIMKNKCCTTCRIFNWDHLMMFSPMVFLGSFFAWSLIVMAVIVWGIWEIGALLFPERFTVYGNLALKCSKCTDRLCRKPRGDKDYMLKETPL